MKIRDKHLKESVSVCDRNCPGKSCYWPRPDPGAFVQGRGYASRGEHHKADWICGTRAAHGCPD